MAGFEKDKVYMELLCHLRKLIDSDFKDGGWLPPRRQMEQRLNASSVTYVKASKRLVAECMAESFARKGIYVIPEQYRPKKLGIVIDDGGEAPFWVGSKIIQKILSRLERRGYWVHQIQGNSVTNIVRCALSHYVSGLIWVHPPGSMLTDIKDACVDKLIPLMCVQAFYPCMPNEAYPPGIPYVSEDYSSVGARLLEPLVRRRHTKIAWCGRTRWETELVEFRRALSDLGLPNREQFCGECNSHNSGEITRLVMKYGVTGIIIHNVNQNLELAFREIAALPDKRRPEVVVWSNAMLSKIHQQFPEVNIIGTVNACEYKFGKIAVDTLLDNLHHPERITPVKINALEINTQENHK
jgi:DNA-binding LacI/PurR family transcriptional regulator